MGLFLASLWKFEFLVIGFSFFGIYVALLFGVCSSLRFGNLDFWLLDFLFLGFTLLCFLGFVSRFRFENWDFWIIRILYHLPLLRLCSNRYKHSCGVAYEHSEQRTVRIKIETVARFLNAVRPRLTEWFVRDCSFMRHPTTMFIQMDQNNHLLLHLALWNLMRLEWSMLNW